MISETDNSDLMWKSISIGDTKWSICALEINDTWKVSMTNLMEIWTEELDKSKILEKCEKLNPSLTIEDIDVYQFVREILQDIPKYCTKACLEQIKLSCELEGGIFQFTIDLTKGDTQQLWEQVMMPFCLAAGELTRRHTILLDLVKKKDAEISEYKLNGAELIRKHIETEPFDEDVFKKNGSTQTAQSCHDAFQTIMRFQGNVETERRCTENTKPIKTRPTEIPKIEETSVKIEVEEHPDENTADLVINIATPLKIEDNLNPEKVDQQSNARVVENNGPPEFSQFPKSSKSQIESKNCKTDAPKRTRSAPVSPTKRMRKNIHDFIK